MILRNLVCDAVVSYFESDDWKELMRNLMRGKEVRHIHIYVDSILHPRPLLRVVEEYFKAQRLPLQRRPYVTAYSPGSYGMTDIYNIHPRQDMAHFELALRYSKNHVLAPIGSDGTWSGKSLEVWDDKYMERFYAKYDFKTKLTSQDEKDLTVYFVSREWRLLCNFMLGGPSRHAHALVETCIHPEVIQEYAIRAIEAKGWEVSRASSVVYAIRGCDFGKLTILLKKPEVMLELEWDYNPDVSIKPGAEPVILRMDIEDLYACMQEIDYIELDEPAVQEIIESLKAKAQ